MDTKKEAQKYLNKYFKAQFINENDDEYKSLVRLLNKAQKQVKNCSIPAVIKSVCLHPMYDILGCPFNNQECEKCQHKNH